MRRAGWGVYLLPQLGGSFEESPPSLLDHAQRDRRWCQGNLQHLAVIGAAGLHPLSRFHLATGIMAYLASPLWLGFIVVGILAALQTKFELPQYFFPNRTPYPVWQVIDSELAINLFGATLAVLLAPKFFGWLAIAVRPREAALFGGRGRALLNVAIETLFSALLAPVATGRSFWGRNHTWKMSPAALSKRATRFRSLAGVWGPQAILRPIDHQNLQRPHMIAQDTTAASAPHPWRSCRKSGSIRRSARAIPQACWASRPIRSWRVFRAGPRR